MEFFGRWVYCIRDHRRARRQVVTGAASWIVHRPRAVEELVRETRVSPHLYRPRLRSDDGKRFLGETGRICPPAVARAIVIRGSRTCFTNECLIRPGAVRQESTGKEEGAWSETGHPGFGALGTCHPCQGHEGRRDGPARAVCISAPSRTPHGRSFSATRVDFLQRSVRSTALTPSVVILRGA